MATFNDFVTEELPKRPFVTTDGTAGQKLVRSSNPLAPREVIFVDDTPGGGPSASLPQFNSASIPTTGTVIIDNIAVASIKAVKWLVSVTASNGDASSCEISCVLLKNNSSSFNKNSIIGDRLCYVTNITVTNGMLELRFTNSETENLVFSVVRIAVMK